MEEEKHDELDPNQKSKRAKEDQGLVMAEESMSVEWIFEAQELNLTTGITPSLNVSADLLRFFFVKTWTRLLEKSGLPKQPFTRQENTVIQTCVAASSGVAFSGLRFGKLAHILLCDYEFSSLKT
ncbi:probable metal-nicotianamine transporter YSL8 [Cucurbita pepo subsp. pepo]|uniref:probable metal-nicotianamine transporter YSL8 n=1 Tax=Cucurbita pepo subsp. pepo TaxID=3664 RepID=UPI000C9D77ED|nr:probable metal-nicotianamine transporter YSL8 [Cucurbita pepo subsp. pepo]